MYTVVLNAIFILSIVALAFSITYSVKYRRIAEPTLRGVAQAKQNIAMGFLLVLLALYPLYLMPGTSIRIIIGIAFALIGLFNLFAGFRNLALFRSRS